MDSTPATLLEQLRGPTRPEAWSRFVRLFTPLLLRWAERIGVPAADRADVIQDVFLTLLKTLPTFQYEPNRSFRAWLYTVLANKWKDSRKARRPGPLVDEPADAADPVEAIDAAEYRTVVLGRALGMLKPEFQPITWEAFRATAIEGRPAAEVAVQLGLSCNAVYLARSRVLQRLRTVVNGLID